ncbi:unnamed protein product [Peronospora belbahrii]|uniref:Uncharacterized protein n=1 Tax=Peronospora belbahrii TaxID=622444 RepID=A0ABN8D3Z4_9STRA|nr:unnamed protein product [Peronospora belbahrii]
MGQASGKESNAIFGRRIFTKTCGCHMSTACPREPERVSGAFNDKFWTIFLFADGDGKHVCEKLWKYFAAAVDWLQIWQVSKFNARSI